MNSILQRGCRLTRSQVRRRVLCVGGSVVVAAGVWHLSRNIVTEKLTQSSFGFSARNELFAETLGRRYPSLPVIKSSGYNYGLLHSSAPPGRFIAWVIDVPSALPAESQKPRDLWGLVNDRFELLGRVRGWLSFWGGQPGDWDGEGNVEVVVPWTAGINAPSGTAPHAWAVVRIGAETNAIVGIVAAGPDPMAKSSLRLMWEESNRGWSLALVAISVTRLPSGGFTSTRGDTLARFRWTKPGGILVLDEQSKISDLLMRIPPVSFPIDVDPYTDIDAIITDLLSEHQNDPASTLSPSSAEAAGNTS